MTGETFASLVARGCALRAFIARVEARGGHADAEGLDLVVVRAFAIIARAAEREPARLAAQRGRGAR